MNKNYLGTTLAWTVGISLATSLIFIWDFLADPLVFFASLPDVGINSNVSRRYPTAYPSSSLYLLKLIDRRIISKYFHYTNHISLNFCTVDACFSLCNLISISVSYSISDLADPSFKSFLYFSSVFCNDWN